MSNLPFVEEILADLRRFKECVEDDQDVDCGRDRLDLLTQLGLLERVQRSPALWQMSQAGEDAIAQPASGEPEQQTAINADDLPTKKYPLGAFNFAAPVAAGEPVGWIIDWPDEPELGHYFGDSPAGTGSRSRPLYAAPPAAAHGDEAVLWVECGERLPESGHPVLAFYTNRSGKGRRIRANYVAPKTHEVDFADPDTQCVEYDEEGDCFYLQSGWYELIDNWEEYSSIAVIEGEISHWMPLPAQPAMRVQAGEGGEV